MELLSGLKSLFFLLLLTITVHPSEGKKNTVSFWRSLRFIGASVDVGNFAEILSNFFGFGGNDSDLVGRNDSDLNAERLTKEIGDLINKSKVDVLAALLETSKLDRTNEVVKALHSSLKDLQYMIDYSEDKKLMDDYKTKFIENFKGNKLLKHIRFLPKLLTYIVPGLDKPLLQQVKEKLKCDQVAIDKFVHLITAGIGLQATFEEFTKNVTLENVLKTEWQESLDKVQSDFDSVERACFDELTKRAMQCASGATSEGISMKVLGAVLIVSYLF